MIIIFCSLLGFVGQVARLTLFGLAVTIVMRVVMPTTVCVGPTSVIARYSRSTIAVMPVMVAWMPIIVSWPLTAPFSLIDISITGHCVLSN